MIIGTGEALCIFVNDFNSQFKLGEFVHGLGVLCFYENNIVRNENYSVSTHADDKLNPSNHIPYIKYAVAKLIHT